jgi:hypothetical protein
MNKAFGIMAMALILFVIGFMIYNSSETAKTITDQTIDGVKEKRLREVTEKIECYTKTKDFTCGTVTFQFNSDAIKSETETVQVVEEQPVEVKNEDGTTSTVIQNVTVTKEVPKVSNADLTYLDKQTGQFMVCKRGHQCTIESHIELFNIDGDYVDPPYLYSLTITCEYRDFCNGKSTVSTNAGTVTDGGGGLSYDWTTDSHDELGDYQLILNIRSAVPDLNGNPINLTKVISLVLIS